MLLWRESFITTGKKKFKSSVWRVVLLCQFLVLAITTGKKKVLVICLAGCAVVSVIGSGGKQAVYFLGQESFITTGKKVLVVFLAGCAVVSVFGSGNYDRKKKGLVVGLAGSAVVSVFGSGGKLAVFLLWRESGSGRK